MELVQLQRQLAEFQTRGVRLVALSVDDVEGITKMRNAAEATFDFLSDPEGQALDALDMRHITGGIDGGDIAQSATFLLSPDAKVLWQHVSENYRVRPDPEDILKTIDEVL